MGVERQEELGFSLGSLLLMGSNNRSLGIGQVSLLSSQYIVGFNLLQACLQSCLVMQRGPTICANTALGQAKPAAYPLQTIRERLLAIHKPEPGRAQCSDSHLKSNMHNQTIQTKHPMGISWFLISIKMDLVRVEKYFI